MSTTDKCLKETHEYSAEDAKFMEMAIQLSVVNIGTGVMRSGIFPAVCSDALKWEEARCWSISDAAVAVMVIRLRLV